MYKVNICFLVYNNAHYDGHCGGFLAAPEQREALVSVNPRKHFVISVLIPKKFNLQPLEVAASHICGIPSIASLCHHRVALSE